jgi:hypothetical protein
MHLGAIRSPAAYGRVGGFNSAAAKKERKARFATVDAVADSENDLARVAREAIEERLSNSRPGDDPARLAKLRSMLDRRTAANLQAVSAQQDHQRAAEVASTEAEKERAFLESFTRRQREIDPDFDFDTWQAENEERRQENAAFRRRQARSAQAVAAREIPIENLPKRKRRKTYTWRRLSEGGPTYEDVRGSYTTPVTLW